VAAEAVRVINNIRLATGASIMIHYVRKLAMIALLAMVAACQSQSGPAQTAAQADPVLDADAKGALKSLYANTPKAQELGAKATGILVFPSVVRAGFIAGATHGEGILYEHGVATGIYATTSATFGMQAGVQKYGYAMFFMTQDALNNLKTSPNFAVGMAPTIVVADAGTARNLNTTTLQAPIYAFVFDQKGLMAGLGLEGSKITKREDLAH
jgi:lipid-binding SYLF domain-containing protein